MLREKIDKHYSKGMPISFDTVALHDVAALLKLFLRELPEPLLVSERVNAFIKVDSKCTFLLLLLTEFCQFLCSLLGRLFDRVYLKLVSNVRTCVRLSVCKKFYSFQ